jgi:hypothetical protein
MNWVVDARVGPWWVRLAGERVVWFVIDQIRNLGLDFASKFLENWGMGWGGQYLGGVLINFIVKLNCGKFLWVLGGGCTPQKIVFRYFLFFSVLI